MHQHTETAHVISYPKPFTADWRTSEMATAQGTHLSCGERGHIILQPLNLDEVLRAQNVHTRGDGLCNLHGKIGCLKFLSAEWLGNVTQSSIPVMVTQRKQEGQHTLM